MPYAMSCDEWHDRDIVESTLIEIDTMHIGIHSCSTQKGVFFRIRECIEWMAMRVTPPITHLDEYDCVIVMSILSNNIYLSPAYRVIRRHDGISFRLEISECDDLAHVTGFPSGIMRHTFL